MDQSLIIVGYLFTVIALIVGFIFLRSRSFKNEDDSDEDRGRPVNLGRRSDRKGGKKKKKRRGLDSARRAEDDDEEDEEVARAREERRRREDEARRQQREAMRKIEREKAALRAKKAEKYAAKLAAKREAREAERAAREQEEAEKKKKMKEEEEALYKKWAGEIEMEGEGTEGVDKADMESKMNAFVEYIKKYKVVVLDDLATEFEMKTKDAVARIQTLEKEAKLTGIMDETGGKFIHITKDEMAKVATFIKSKGRVCVDDIVAQSNKFIDLAGS